MAKGKRYFSLLTKEPDGQWAPQFGDYDRETVAEEMESYREDSGWPEGTKFRILSSGDTQAAINEAVAKLNAKESA